MKLEREQPLCAPLQRCWEALNDIAVLRSCIPGCESLTEVGAATFDLLLVAAVGPVKAKFKGTLQLADVSPPHSYTLHFEGQGGVAGHAKGSARVDLRACSENETLLRYSAQALVGGKVAQVGSRLVDMAAQKLAKDFFRALDEHLRTGDGVVLS